MRHVARIGPQADVMPMDCDGARRDAEGCGDLVGGHALCHELQNATLAAGEVRGRFHFSDPYMLTYIQPRRRRAWAEKNVASD